MTIPSGCSVRGLRIKEAQSASIRIRSAIEEAIQFSVHQRTAARNDGALVVVLKQCPSPSMGESSSTTDAADADDADEEEEGRDNRCDNVEPKVRAH